METTRTVPSTSPLQGFQRKREFLLAAQHVAAEFAVDASGGGQFERTLAAIQQSYSEAAFHLLHVLASCGLADPTMLGPPAHAPGGSYLSEKSLFPELHRDSIP